MNQTLARVLLEAICIGGLVTYGYAHGQWAGAAATAGGICLVWLWLTKWGIDG